jgi:hypothetical protein
MNKFKPGDVITPKKLLYFDRYRKAEVGKYYVVIEVLCTGYFQLQGLFGYWNPDGFSLKAEDGK